MKKLCLPVLVFLTSCGSSGANNSDAENLNEPLSTVVKQQGGIVGEWEQQYSAFDKNGNYKLEPEEKKASGTNLGFNWFKFNADGTCLRDKEIKFKGTYEVQEKKRNQETRNKGWR